MDEDQPNCFQYHQRWSLRLEITAKIAHQLDEEMGKIRDDIQEAQALFDPLSRKLNDGVGNSDDTDEEYR